MDDLISRQAAIDAIDKIFPADPMRNDYTQGITCGAALATEYIKQLPSVQPEPHWIPCSERLPERSIEVLTYTALVNLIEIQTLERDEHGFMYWENQHGDRQDMTVTAWMPLPEPYQGGEMT